MYKLFENNVLDDLYKIRGKELESVYEQKYGLPKEKKNAFDAEDKFTDILEEYIIDKNELQEVIDEFDSYKHYAIKLSEFWRKQHYKQAFVDCMLVVNAIMQGQKDVSNDTLKLYFNEFVDFMNQKKSFVHKSLNTDTPKLNNDELLNELSERIEDIEKEIIDFIDVHTDVNTADQLKQLITTKDSKLEKYIKRREELL